MSERKGKGKESRVNIKIKREAEKSKTWGQIFSERKGRK